MTKLSLRGGRVINQTTSVMNAFAWTRMETPLGGGQIAAVQSQGNSSVLKVGNIFKHLYNCLHVRNMSTLFVFIANIPRYIIRHVWQRISKQNYQEGSKPCRQVLQLALILTTIIIIIIVNCYLHNYKEGTQTSVLTPYTETNHYW